MYKGRFCGKWVPCYHSITCGGWCGGSWGTSNINKVRCYVTLCGSSELVGFYDLGSESSDSIKGGRLVE